MLSRDRRGRDVLLERRAPQTCQPTRKAQVPLRDEPDAALDAKAQH